MCMEEEVCYSIVENAVTEEQPDGCLTSAWMVLLDKFQPKTGTKKVELTREFNNSALDHRSRTLAFTIEEVGLGHG